MNQNGCKANWSEGTFARSGRSPAEEWVLQTGSAGPDHGKGRDETPRRSVKVNLGTKDFDVRSGLCSVVPVDLDPWRMSAVHASLDIQRVALALNIKIKIVKQLASPPRIQACRSGFKTNDIYSRASCAR